MSKLGSNHHWVLRTDASKKLPPAASMDIVGSHHAENGVGVCEEVTFEPGTEGMPTVLIVSFGCMRSDFVND